MDLLHNPYVAFFLIVALGLLLGKIKIKGISLDVSAIIFVALVFGHYGIKMPDIFQKIGLIFFIYSVGIQAGPGFFDSFKKDGLNLIGITAIVVISGAITTVGLAWAFDINFKLAAGLFTGALTSTPGLAAAIESTQSPLASIGYGISYPLGVLGVILFVKIAPKLFGISIEKEEKQYEEHMKEDYPDLYNKNFIVENQNIFEKTLGTLKIRTMTGCNISRVLNNNNAFTPTSDTVFHQGDVIKVVGTTSGLEKVRLLIGKETNIKIPLGTKYAIRTVLVTNEKVVRKSLAELGIFEQYDATVTSIRRSGIDIIPNASSRLRFGDKLTIACNEQQLGQVIDLLGDSKKKLSDLDFLPVSAGIIIGILISTINIPLFGLNMKLGLTGGVLIAAILLSKIGKTGNIIWNVSGTSNQLLRKLGLIFFLTSVGTNAGEHLVETISQGGLLYLLTGAAITIIPMFLAIVIGRYVFKINFLVLIGALTGAMTSTPALSAVEPLTECNAPKISYATVYPFALVLIILCSQLMSLL